MTSFANNILFSVSVATSSWALGSDSSSQVLNREHGYFLAGGTLTSVADGAAYAHAGWHTPLVPALRGGLQISSLVNRVAAPEGGTGGITYYHLGPALEYRAYSWGSFSSSVYAGAGMGRVGYRRQKDNEFISSGVTTYFAALTADYDASDKLRLSAGWHLQQSFAVKVKSLSNKSFSGSDVYVAITTFR